METSTNHDLLRVVLTNINGVVQSRTTLGEFLKDNPDLVVDSSDIKQMIDHQGYWLWDGGAAGVFKVMADTQSPRAAGEAAPSAFDKFYSRPSPIGALNLAICDAIAAKQDDLFYRHLVAARDQLEADQAKIAALARHWGELAFHANVLANARTKAERDSAAMKVFCAIGEAKDTLPGLRTLAEARAALALGKEGA